MNTKNQKLKFSKLKFTNSSKYSQNSATALSITSPQKLQQDWDYLVHICDQIHKKTGAKHGKILNKLLKDSGASQEDIQDVATLLTSPNYKVVFSSGQNEFINAYDQVHSCMKGNGKHCHVVYSEFGIFIAGIKEGIDYTARALVTSQGYFNKAYGNYHYLLVSVLKILGCLRSDKWLGNSSLNHLSIRGFEAKFIKATVVYELEKTYQVRITPKKGEVPVFCFFNNFEEFTREEFKEFKNQIDHTGVPVLTKVSYSDEFDFSEEAMKTAEYYREKDKLLEFDDGKIYNTSQLNVEIKVIKRMEVDYDLRPQTVYID